ncbi:nuclear transport factor 2 family protein [Myxococcota bacterium]|nr:nuclear transport factor 2 family protein [Myxococcota bacterium]
MSSDKPFDLARSRCDAQTQANLDQVERFFGALDAMDFAAVGAMFSADGLYRDMPVVPDSDARGPAAIEKKLTQALGGLDAFVTGVTRVLAQGDVVMTERVEVWHLPSGEKPALPVMAIHELEEGKITAWREYWDMATFVGQLPASWMEELARRREA